ncbi:uncharacterized protein E0L32_003653 [Thyridium curvatum]|uniref:Conidiation-specific protein 8 n=1 Tax=Thyridium curvatum TaxID=1093900 RepID=A0A507B385_9PEZI|nr:uncharacterized protein E0L32_003653 [Thyridium curvatum]TPX16712.1 hypothetical protein E0L32_003653 [Thyridium curvatum]
MDSQTTAKQQRSDSMASTGSAGSAASPRRASHGSGGLFASLHEQKRSSDPAQQARRQSLNEQRPTPGFLGKMWQNWVHGPQQGGSTSS